MKSESIICSNPHGTHRMAYTEWGEASQKPSIVCIHGLTRNGRDFDRLATALEQSGRHVICPDIVGRGKSDYLLEHPELYGYEQYVSDISSLLRAKDLTQVDWVGTSMGGLIGMMMAAAENTILRRLVLNDIGTFIPLAALKRIGTYAAMVIEFADDAQLERHMRAIYAPFGITREEDWRHMVKYSQRKLPNGHLALAYDPAIAQNFSAVEEDFNVWPAYDAIKIPTLLLRGELSDVLPAETAQAMTQRGPKAQLITYANVGHAPALMDAQQIADVQNFLTEG